MGVPMTPRTLLEIDNVIDTLDVIRDTLRGAKRKSVKAAYDEVGEALFVGETLVVELEKLERWLARRAA